MNRYYYCKTQDCPIHNSGYNKFDKPQRCPACKQPLSIKLELTGFEQDVIDNYPYVIAFPFKRMLEEENQMKNLVFTFLNTLKYMALIVATEYYRSPFRNEYLNKLFRDGIAKPYHGTWNMFLTKAIAFLEQNNHSFLIPELPLAYDAIETGKRHNNLRFYPINKEVTNFFGDTVMESLDEKDIYRGKATVIRALLFYRNKYDGHAPGSITESEANNINKKIYDLLTDLLKALDFLKNYPLLKSDGRNYWSMMGCTVKKEGWLVETINQEENVWIQDNKGKRLPLLPFLIQQNHYQIGLQNPAEVMMIEQFTGERIIFHSPEGKTAEFRGDVLKELNLLFEQKEKEEPFNLEHFTDTQLASRIKKHNKIAESELREERKIIAGIYQRREDAEIELRSWVGSIFGLFFLAAEAGTGKTNLLWEMKRQYEDDFKLDTLFIRANRMHHVKIEDELKRIFNLASNAKLESSPVFQRPQDKPLMILIDGGNENKNRLELLAGIPALLAKLSPGSLKIVLSWRATNDNELPEIDNEWKGILYSITTSNTSIEIEPKKIFWLRPMNKIELQGAWSNYTNHPSNKSYKVKFSLNDLTLVDRPLAEQLNNPLLLRLFLELFNGKTLKEKPAGFTNIWSLWWNMKAGADSAQNEFLIRLAVLMAENGANAVILDTLYEDEFLGPIIRSYEKISPYNRLLNTGILTHYIDQNISYLSFTIESVWFYALSRYLAKTITVSNGLEKFITKGKQWEQAAMFYLWDAVQQNKKDILIGAIKNKNIDAAITSKPLAQALTVLDSSKLLETLLRNCCEKEWKVLREAINIIDSAQKTELATSIVNACIPFVNYSIFECCDLLSDYMIVLNNSLVIDIKDIFIEKLKLSYDLKMRLSLTAGIAAYYMRDLGNPNYENATGFAKQTLSLCIEIYGPENEHTAFAYIRLGDAYYDDSEANIFYQNAKEIFLKIYGADSGLVASSYLYIARSYYFNSRYEDALNLQNKALNIYLKLYGTLHCCIASAYGCIADTYYFASQYEKSIKYYHNSLTIHLQLGIENTRIAYDYESLGKLSERLNKYDDAINYYQKSLNIYFKFYGEEHSIILDNVRELFHLYYKVKDWENFTLAQKIIDAIKRKENTHLALCQLTMFN